MKITNQIKKKFIATKFCQIILPDLTLSKEDKDKVEQSIKDDVMTEAKK